jgi:hypothetical protein
MGNVEKVVRFSRSDRQDRPKDGYRMLREEFGLSIIAAAAALETSAQKIELWEAQGIGPGEDLVRMKFETYVHENSGKIPSNLLIGTFPLSLAREILGMSVEDISSKYGYSTSAWYKFEKNQRLLNRDSLYEIEEAVRDKFAAACIAAGSSI